MMGYGAPIKDSDDQKVVTILAWHDTHPTHSSASTAEYETITIW